MPECDSVQNSNSTFLCHKKTFFVKLSLQSCSQPLWRDLLTPRMNIYKRLLSTSTVAVGIALISVVQFCYYFHFHSMHHYSSTSSNAQLLEFTLIDVADDKVRFSRRKQRLISVENEESFYRSSIQISEKEPEIKLLLSPQELQWVKIRGDLFHRWYNKTALTIRHNSYPLLTKRVVALPTNTSNVINGRNQPKRADFVASTLVVSTFPKSESAPETHPTHPLAISYSNVRVRKSVHVDEEGPWLDFVIIGNP
jgi:hypothetical protein